MSAFVLKVIALISMVCDHSSYVIFGRFSFLNYIGRIAGKTKWNYRRLINLSIDGITSFTTSPLRWAAILGIIISCAGFLYMLAIILKTLIYGVDVSGYASMMVVILFLGGIQLIFLGLIGEYLGRAFSIALTLYLDVFLSLII